MGTKNNPGAFDCYENAEPDEPMFVLLARDPIAPILVREWALNRIAGAVLPGGKPVAVGKVEEAERCAKDMEEWRKKNRP